MDTLLSPPLTEQGTVAPLRTEHHTSSWMREYIREIQTALHDVNPLTVEEWETAFHRAGKPARELAYWLHVARLYNHVADEFGPEMNHEQRKRCLHDILARVRA